MSKAAGIELKLIHGADLEILSPIIRSKRWVPLNPATACAFVAYEGEEIVGFLAQNPLPHVEPLWVANTHRGTGLAEELVKEMVSFLYAVAAPAAFIIADNPISERLAQAYGMEKIDSPVYRIQVR